MVTPRPPSPRGDGARPEAERRAAWLARSGRPGQALDVLLALDREGQAEPRTLVAIGDLYLRLGAPEDALRFWARAPAPRHPHPPGAVAPGAAFNRAGDEDDRHGDLDSAVRCWLLAARAFEAEGFLHQALGALGKATRRAPERLGLPLEVARLHARLGHVVEASRLYRDVAAGLLQAGSEEPAVGALEHALALDAGDAEARRTLARLHARRGRPQAAARELAALAEAARAGGRLAEARDALEQARELDPGAPALTAALDDVYVQLGEWEEMAPLEEPPARPAAPRAAAIAPRDVLPQLDRALHAIRDAGALVIVAGGGLNSSFGWPEYRDDESLWRDFPAYRTLRLRITDLARPGRFDLDPELAWGFYARRRQLAAARPPHEGLHLLGRWRALAPGGGFVVTSCVEGEYAAAGFDPARVVECCGSILRVQCSRRCGAPPVALETWPEVDRATLRAREPLPRCSHCDALARPNVLLYGDCDWDTDPFEASDSAFRQWVSSREGLVVLECGETPRLPVLRNYARERLAGSGALFIRISDTDASVPDGGLSLPTAPRVALEALDERLRRRG